MKTTEEPVTTRVTDVRTSGEVAARTPMLEIAGSRCERHGHYRLDTLIARHPPRLARASSSPR